jgi:hypothetical protein
MSLFATPVTKTGTDVLREALRIRLKKGSPAQLSLDVGVGVAALENWAAGSGRLPDDVMGKIAKWLFGDNVSFDAARNLLVRKKPTMLRSTAPPPKAPVRPPPRAPAAGWPGRRSHRRHSRAPSPKAGPPNRDLALWHRSPSRQF